MTAKHTLMPVLKMMNGIYFAVALLVAVLALTKGWLLEDCMEIYLILSAVMVVSNAAILLSLRWKCCFEDNGIAVMRGNRVFKKICYEQILRMVMVPADGYRAPVLDEHGKQLCVIACSTKETNWLVLKDRRALLGGGKHCIFPRNMNNEGAFVVPYEVQALRMLLERTDAPVYVSVWAYERFKTDIDEMKDVHPERIWIKA